MGDCREDARDGLLDGLLRLPDLVHVEALEEGVPRRGLVKEKGSHGARARGKSASVGAREAPKTSESTAAEK
jgi:hypothetical protein